MLEFVWAREDAIAVSYGESYISAWSIV